VGVNPNSTPFFLRPSPVNRKLRKAPAMKGKQTKRTKKMESRKEPTLSPFDRVECEVLEANDCNNTSQGSESDHERSTCSSEDEMDLEANSPKIYQTLAKEEISKNDLFQTSLYDFSECYQEEFAFFNLIHESVTGNSRNVNVVYDTIM
jgi:hypothetical protein